MILIMLKKLILNTSQDDAEIITKVSKPTALITAIPLIAEAGVDLMTREVSLSAEAWKEEYRKLRLILWERS